jgi:hypothetical protein
MISRRSLFLGLSASLIAAPAVVRAASLMPVRGIVMPVEVSYWMDYVTMVQSTMWGDLLDCHEWAEKSFDEVTGSAGDLFQMAPA